MNTPDYGYDEDSIKSLDWVDHIRLRPPGHAGQPLRMGSDFSTVCGPEDVTDPTGPEKGQNHPYRGGSWNHYASMCRAAKSFEAPPTYRVHSLGFRVVMVKE